jgi:hypothetical protein
MPFVDDLQTAVEEDITVDATAGGVRLTIANLIVTPPIRRVELFLEDAQIRISVDPATAPTASSGEILNPFDRYTLKNITEAWNFRAIRTGGTSATLRARYFR